MANENVFKVKLVSQVNPSRKVIFDATPDLSESTQVDYRSVQPVHMPGTIYVYGSTSSRTFDLSNTRLVSRTQDEASVNLQRLQLLRAWTKPVFGLDPAQTSLDQTNPAFAANASTSETFAETADTDILGAPPEVLYLTAYSNNSNTETLQHINQVPVVIQTLNIPYPSDQDYIPTNTGVPMPTIMNISITLVESHSPREFETFSLADYRKGNLVHF